MPEPRKYLALRVSRAVSDEEPRAAKRGSLASVATGSEEARTVLQERMELFFRSMFAVSFGFSVLMAFMLFATGVASLGESLSYPINQIHQFVNLVLLAVTLIFRFARVSRAALQVLDAILITIVTSLFAVIFAISNPNARPELLLSLTTLTMCVLRAVLIPSTASRTLAITAVAAAPSIIVAWVVHREPHIVNAAGTAMTRVSIALYTAIWWLLQIVVATLTTRVIYGLRQRVREARQLGQYVLEEELGEGGMGVVYRASHALLRRPTAVKLLAADRVGEHAIKRFAREVRLTARLTHPNTVTIYDYGRTPEGIFYYAMELLDGINLEELVQRSGPLPPARVRHVLIQVGEALAEAHAIGLIHRDVKPANIMLCRQIGRTDVAKLLDFGLVRDLEGADKTRSDIHSLTGTPLYMAPESIVNPGAIDARADLYALAAVGYFLLVGAPVFEAKTIVEVCGLHLHAQPTPPSVRLGAPVPARLEGALLRGLAKDPDRRFPSADAFVNELRALDDVETWTPADAHAWWTTYLPVGSDGSAGQGKPRSAPGARSRDGDPLPAMGIDWRGR